MSVISYPVPLYQNLPIESDFYIPRNKTIASITQGITTTVETTAANEFVVGQLVRFIIPPAYGIRQLNHILGHVVQVNSTTEFVVDVNTVGMDAFISASSNENPQITPVGDQNSGCPAVTSRSTNQTFIDGSFRNISPQ